MSKLAELKSCPFCGGEAEFKRIGDRRQSCIVHCTDCGATLESNETFDSGEHWNRRVDYTRGFADAREAAAKECEVAAKEHKRNEVAAKFCHKGDARRIRALKEQP